MKNYILVYNSWFEQDPYEYIASIKECIVGVVGTEGVSVDDIKGVGITNQRETTILWDRTTGRCFYNAIGQVM